MILIGEAQRHLPDLPTGSVQTIITSPPYFGLRDYGVEGQIGLGQTPAEYIAELTAVFREARRVLADDGTLWLNMGDSYGAPGGDIYTGFNERYHGTHYQGQKQAAVVPHTPRKAAFKNPNPKSLMGMPWRVAFALQDDGWILRQDIIWHKPNPMPESVRDRCTKAHEYIFLFAKQPRYYYDHEAVKEPAVSSPTGRAASFKRENSKRAQAIPGQSAGTHRPDREDVAYNGALRNRRSVWTVGTRGYPGAHFAVFPEALIEPCVLAGSRVGDTVLDPFMGSGTTGIVAQRHDRHFIGIELNAEYAELAKRRMNAPSN